MVDISDLALGTAAEHLVCADLLLAGYRAFLADQNCPYDVAVDTDQGMIKIQVKATRTVRAIPQRREHKAAYMFHVRRAGKKGKRVYAENEFDLLALVAVDVKQIAYLPPSKQRMTVHIRAEGQYSGTKQGKTFSDYALTAALEEIRAKV